ncbi:AraC family transcriptional regulator [Leptospira levettii]|uniref:AraC family transcriptional regulator n=1 Tax=Leptospira levettii TaxID=2023178 RepID=A0ABY2MTY5_9LEPT|nr:helix-turn-helix domain-containing protein [Leptospira levettii]TGL75454.1 AraC family transcriptional regulator [Leptospira levettii]TGM26743.1 AraC family transcriptional regulator [Leptospira levettii]TGM75217.1 AraC family transcriptional regulator [Leptospira levettii]TGM85819.1 AraC family transcriptional regulator [Leptospira levettii]
MFLIPFAGAIVSFLLFLSHWLETYQVRGKQYNKNRNPSYVSLSNLVKFNTNLLYDYSSALLFLIVSLVQFHMTAEFANSFSLFPYLFGFHIPLLLLIGPLCYLYFEKMSNGSIDKVPFIHLVPSILSIGFILLLRATNGNDIMNLGQSKFWGQSSEKWIFLLLGLGVVSIFFYTSQILFLFVKWRIQSKEDLKTSFPPFLRLIVYTTSITFLFLIAQIFYMEVFLLACSGLFLLLIYIFLQRTNRFEMIPNFETETSVARYKESRTKGIDIQHVIKRLDYLMNIEHLYTNEELTLQTLASRLDLDSHQLSEILNHNLGIGFRNYINEFRLETAAKLLKENPGMTIIRIIYASGFNSKSAFHTLFQKKYGVTPQVYRKNFL